ncbi:pyruvate dehydrogenase (acetyl-transferring), homodimeric type [Immundisolibacter sp.]|uniref:pyruvate dehydrogenase (acetyl-transferring), homodimeric type n=1 Tax=Immundisolibacter sp. TaxID=1934948 RepID=UPI0026029697|nr:pyruvate dehydrogenase (acetyl-transferring), homodimeric type [Immundisolibacter sp.]MDD3651877.1 pyruvate dehydrogenase (acetyl-transferring), homodimeric type [Immundisolibacter sp.]
MNKPDSGLPGAPGRLGLDVDPLETRDWLDALRSLTAVEGEARARFILETLLDEARNLGIGLPQGLHTAYLNTIPADRQPPYPGDLQLEGRIRAALRWNAMIMVTRANRESTELGGHIASYASLATIYEVGFNHFFHAPSDAGAGDLVFFQGHSSPGMYARAFLEGRLTERDLNNFRQELAPGGGLSSYPHPWLMPEFWSLPTVSMGLAPMMAIYQARFMAYLDRRGLASMDDRKVYAFLGDGEMDEPESRGALSVAGREKLDNLIFVVNCNLQRLDGPVRGNGKIIQELESEFRGNGWNVIKVIWGSEWDELLARDRSGLLRKRMEEAIDGEYQAYKARGGKYTRERFFGKYPELLRLVEHLSDDDIYRLRRGGHDPLKIYAAFDAAVRHRGQPTVILFKTVKGYGMGSAGEAQNITHQQKKMTDEQIRAFRDRFKLPIPDEQLAALPYYKPADDSPEMQYLHARRQALGGYLPVRRHKAPPLTVPALDAFEKLLEGSGERDISTTMAFVRILTQLTRDPHIGRHVVPIVPDEARTFGMEGLFRQLGIYSPEGQLYEPEDAGHFMFYREDKQGQILEEGINEAGAFCSWIAAGTSYAMHGVSMIPFYIFYSMFGFQRVGDFAWAAGDMRTRGFLIGGTAGRTTLAGEGLQHQDGHSHLLASTIPNCVAYDPAYLYELAVIIQDGMRRMYEADESVYYYITVENENYAHPPMPDGARDGILRGLYRLPGAEPKKTRGKASPRVQLLGSGAILREALAAAELLQEFGVHADVWSATSFNELRRDGLAVQRWNRLHPTATPRKSHVERCLDGTAGPVIAATDYMKAYADQIRPWVRGRYEVLGTDGFGRSDTRRRLRQFFEVSREHIAYAALKALADEGSVTVKTVTEAAQKLGIDPERPDPVTV